MLSVVRIISGGQTGADRAGLDFAIANNISHGGWCPRHRRAEDGTIPESYDLTETRSGSYLQRTEQNVSESDGTLIFTIGKELTGGSLATFKICQRYGKPCLHCVQDAPQRIVDPIRGWLMRYGIKTLNVAGSRLSKAPGIDAFVQSTLSEVWKIQT